MTGKFVILIVDDNANNRFSLRALLSRLSDCSVLDADSGDAALLCTVENDVHLILLDVQMPGMDGFETARHLQMTERTRQIPIVFVTAVFKAEEFKLRGFELGAVDYLTKPIDDSLLLSRIRLYKHLYERELSLESAVSRLVENERNLLKAKTVAEMMMDELKANYVQLRRLSSVVEQSPNELMIINTEGIIEYVNPAFVESTGYTAEEVIGRRPDIIESGEAPLKTYQDLWDTIRSGKVWCRELQEHKKDGTFYWVSVYFSAVRDDVGEISHFVGIYVDISERVQVQDKLRLAKESAERANRAKSVFLSSMSHELRTPLNAILGFAQLLERESNLGLESRKKLATINRAGQHLLALINDVLEISRIEAGRSPLTLASFVLQDFLGEVEDMIRGRAESKALAFAVECSPDLPSYVLGDAHHLKQVLINLLGNAVKYTDRGSVRLRVDVHDDMGYFSVIDTGTGIAAADLDRIFQAFYQTEAGIAKGEGTGLGLAISAEYAHLMGGELSVESQLGEGSVFSLKLPLPASEAPEQSRVVNHQLVIGLLEGGPVPRVLVADDNADNRELIFEILTMAGFDVRLVNDGQEAIDAFVSWQPDFIWMDIHMPILDGYAATQQIRGLPGGQEVKIVALTASAFEEDRVAILAAGCDDMVRKPVEETQLFDVMAALLNLQYRYADEKTPVVPNCCQLSDLLMLSEAQRTALRSAAEMLDQEAVQALLVEIRETAPLVAKDLAVMLSEYRFDRILAICDAN